LTCQVSAPPAHAAAAASAPINGTRRVARGFLVPTGDRFLVDDRRRDIPEATARFGSVACRHGVPTIGLLGARGKCNVQTYRRLAELPSEPDQAASVLTTVVRELRSFHVRMRPAGHSEPCVIRRLIGDLRRIAQRLRGSGPLPCAVAAKDGQGEQAIGGRPDELDTSEARSEGPCVGDRGLVPRSGGITRDHGPVPVPAPARQPFVGSAAGGGHPGCLPRQ
jgi:hypothetical protein